MEFTGKIVLVTAGADGIGAATSTAFAREGATVVVTDINLAGARAVAERIGNGSIAAELDASDPDAWNRVMALIDEKFGRLDVLVNNAGVGLGANIEDTSFDTYRREVQINLDSVFIGSKLAIERMKKTGGGSIINMSSIHGIRAAAHEATYSATKGAIRLLTKSIALHCGRTGIPVRCNSVHPGYIRTPMMLDWIARSENPAALEKSLIDQHPIGFLGEPEDIANGCVFLASRKAKFMTGSELVIDGGFTL